MGRPWKVRLDQVWNKFEIANFERQLYRSHVNDIKKAVEKRRLVNFIITVWDKQDARKWLVFDGQHRLNALAELHEEKNLKSFPLVLMKIRAKTEKEAREIYLALNSGKQLVSNDILKAYDNGHIYFFNELRNICAHHSGVERQTYLNALASLHYVKRGVASLRKNFIEDFLRTIENFEVIRMKELLQTMYIVSNNNTKNTIFFANVFRPLTRLYFEDFKNATGKKWENFIKSLEDDQTIKANKGKWTTESCNMIYEYVKNKWERRK